MEMFKQYVEKGLQFVSKHCVQAIRQVDISKVSTLCSLLEALLLGNGGPDLKMVHLTQNVAVMFSPFFVGCIKRISHLVQTTILQTDLTMK